MQTKLIKYNLRERGRQFRGKDRNFNIRAIVDAINSPACQERVKNRDMLGFRRPSIRSSRSFSVSTTCSNPTTRPIAAGRWTM